MKPLTWTLTMLVVILAVAAILPLTMAYLGMPWYGHISGKGMDNIDAFELAYLMVEVGFWLIGLIPCFLYARTLKKEREGS